MEKALGLCVKLLYLLNISKLDTVVLQSTLFVQTGQSDPRWQFTHIHRFFISYVLLLWCIQYLIVATASVIYCLMKFESSNDDFVEIFLERHKRKSESGHSTLMAPKRSRGQDWFSGVVQPRNPLARGSEDLFNFIYIIFRFFTKLGVFF